MADHLARRQNPVSTKPTSELNRWLEVLADELGLEWLNASGNNPVQQLWQRADWLATSELLTLGEAVQNLLRSDAAWTRRSLNEMKASDPGTRSGATFEVLGLNLFQGPYTVVPARANHPGYDGEIVFEDGSSLILSIKNHGMSSGERDFKEHATSVDRILQEALVRRSMNGFRQRIIATRNPGASDWKTLEDRMDDILGGRVSPDATDPWSGLLEPIEARFRPLSDSHLSYALILAAPYHPNEQKNFYSNIQKGIGNLTKHHSKVDSDVCRGLLLRISETANLLDCAAWAQEYFRDFQDTSIEVIFLYQVAVATDQVKDISFIVHYFIPVFGPKFATWHADKKERRLIIRPLIGRVLRAPSRMVMSSGSGTQQLAINGHYLFQHGNIFPFYQIGKRPLNISLSTPAPGVSVMPVINRLGTLGAMSGVLGTIDRSATEDLDWHGVFILVHFRLERPIKGPEEEILGGRAKSFRLSEFFLRGGEKIALGVLFLAFQDLKSPAFPCGQLGVLHAKIPELIRDTDNDAVRMHVSEHAA
jgi:hypothetical protein